MIKILIICLLSLLVISKPLNPKRVKWAVNAGSRSSRQSSQGFTYEEDKDFESDGKSVQVDYSTDQQYAAEVIKYTEDPDIYKTERHSYESFSYLIPMKNLRDGKYVLILKFCEMYFNRANKRVFNINLGGQQVIQNLDVAGAAGRFSAHDQYIEFELLNNLVFFKGKIIEGALVKGKLNVQFQKTEYDNPFINGLILYEGSLQDTDFHDIPQKKETWDRLQREEQKKAHLQKIKREQAKSKKKEKIKTRNDHLDDLEEDFEEFDQTVKEVKPKEERVSLKNLLMSPIGAVLVVGFQLFSYIVVYLIFFDPPNKKQENKQI